MTCVYKDEEVLKIMQAIEDEKFQQAAADSITQEIANQDIAGGQATIYGKVVSFAPRKFLEDRISIVIPKEWNDMEKELVKLKYPNEKRPVIILSDQTTAFNLTINHTVHSLMTYDVENFVKAMKMFTGKTAKAQFIETGIAEKSNNMIGYYDFTVPGFDEELYNFVFCISLENKALIITFNCLAAHQERWKAVVLAMMKSLEVSSWYDQDGRP